MKAETRRKTAIQPELDVTERRWLLRAFACLPAAAFVGCAAQGTTHASSPARERDDDEHDEAEVTPAEDLMQEHGILERVLLIYDEGIRRIDGAQELDPKLVAGAADIVRRFVEEYHEKLEEDFVFPRLEKARLEVELVATLKRQHERGRAVTAEIARLAAAGGVKPELATAMRQFVRMYRPHAAREDTVLFPAFRDVMGRRGYAELGEAFEDQEHQRFGQHGFANTVREVARLEAALGIGDLDRFTP